MKVPTIEERIASLEVTLEHWAKRRAEARDGEESNLARHWEANVGRVLERLRKKQREAA